MLIKNLFSRFAFLTAFLLAMAFGAEAQNVATVNGVQIPDSQFNLMLSVALNRGQPDTPDLRSTIKEELINREILAQAAEKLELNKTPEAKQQWAQIRENFLVELLLIDFNKKNPVSDADVKAQYDREVAQIQSIDAAQQYRVSIIIVPTLQEAENITAQLKKGASFEKLAREKSIDPSKVQGGMLGWVFTSQINPEIGAAIKKLGKGGYTAPIQTQAGWNMVKVDDKRPFKIPAFSDAQNQIRLQLIQKRQIEFIQKLRSEAKIN